MRLLLAASSPLDHVVPQVVFKIGGLAVTNHMIMATVAGLVMILIFPRLFNRSNNDTPTGARNFFEAILQYLRQDVFRPALKENTDRFTPFLWTIFFFVLFCNLLGFIPLSELLIVFSGGAVSDKQLSVRFDYVGGTATGNIATTAALALCAFLFIHLNGIWQITRDLRAGTYGQHHHDGHAKGHEHAVEHAHGAKGMNGAVALAISPALYLWNYAPHLFKPAPGESKVGWLADIPIWAMLLVLELTGALIKPFAMCMRLFASMIAGHIVLAVLISLIPVTLGIMAQIGIGIPITIMSLLIRFLELFVSFLQAYIFTFLTTLFVAAAVAPEH